MLGYFPEQSMKDYVFGDLPKWLRFEVINGFKFKENCPASACRSLEQDYGESQ